MLKKLKPSSGKEAIHDKNQLNHGQMILIITVWQRESDEDLQDRGTITL